MPPPRPPESVSYFHGKITREQAEDLLNSQCNTEGLYLLRESAGGNYAVSICHNGRVHHYNVEKQPDGYFQIPTGRKFVGPVELVEHHSEHLDGFLTLARTPLERSAGKAPLLMQGVDRDHFEELLRAKAAEMNLKGNSIDEALSGPVRDHFCYLVLKDLHVTQVWYHDNIKRRDAEDRLAEAGHSNGNFLVRFRKEDNSFVLSLSYQGEPKHYKIEQRMNKLSIEGGRYFDTLMELVDHYHFRQDGLLCKLKKSIEPTDAKTRSSRSSLSSRSSVSGTNSPSKQWQSSKANIQDIESFDTTDNTTPVPSATQWPPQIAGQFQKVNKSDNSGSPRDLINFADWPNVTNLLSNQNALISTQTVASNPFPLVNSLNLHTTNGPSGNMFPALQWPSTAGNNMGGFAPPPRANTGGRLPSGNSAFVVTSQQNNLSEKFHLLDMPPESLNFPPIIDQTWEEPDLSEEHTNTGSGSGTSAIIQTPVSTGSSTGGTTQMDTFLSEETQLIYDALPRNDLTFNLRKEQLQLKDKLGGGNFGCVVKAIYRPPDQAEVPVAVKMLKEDQCSQTGEEEILREARNMSQLKHRHIVRLIGVCKDEQVMLVLELAPLGPINKYLRKHPDTPVSVITELMLQVAQGMAYLESCKFVHRDLAARNVLLVNKHFAKISDFGMSKALNYGNDYYRAATAGKWPLKWYAPECIYYFRFDSKSDVWSYGITLWEGYSYGERPYKDMKGTQILAMLDQGLRLSKPSRCPDAAYEVMRQCWHAEGVRRPTFAELVLSMARVQAGTISSAFTSSSNAGVNPLSKANCRGGLAGAGGGAFVPSGVGTNNNLGNSGSNIFF